MPRNEGPRQHQLEGLQWHLAVLLPVITTQVEIKELAKREKKK